NPNIVIRRGCSVSVEGCLSMPNVTVEIKRAKEISVSFMDESGKTTVKTFGGITAKAIQHEVDHLNGKLIIDYLPWYKKIFSNKGKEVLCLQ
ncbi:MAG: peptide deformylase, partial [Candidatus Omnitrophica bacterium]|nr:peptide deformylase [Candidatus Omnitrophota bacterium]